MVERPFHDLPCFRESGECRRDLFLTILLPDITLDLGDGLLALL